MQTTWFLPFLCRTAHGGNGRPSGGTRHPIGNRSRDLGPEFTKVRSNISHGMCTGYGTNRKRVEQLVAEPQGLGISWLLGK